MIAERRAKTKAVGLDSFIADLMSKLDPSQSAELDRVIKEKKSKPINVAIIGQSGVGKSTTVNNLFGATERVSRVGEGTVVDNFGGYKEYALEDGSVMRVADLPGYGRGVAEDEKYKALYINTLKDCDVILLIMQANDKAIVDDQYMVECLYEWSNEGLLVNDGTYYGQDTGLEEDFSVKDDIETAPKGETSVDYIKQIEEICEEALRTLDKESEAYQKIKAIFKML